MTAQEWELLCDGCGRCCLVKLEDIDTGELHYTDVACRLLDLDLCRCTDYENRTQRVADCVMISPDNVAETDWLPPTCAYRLLHENKELRWWHPLISGTAQTVDDAGISVRGKIIAEDTVAEDDVQDHCVKWPLSTAEAVPEPEDS